MRNMRIAAVLLLALTAMAEIGIHRAKHQAALIGSIYPTPPCPQKVCPTNIPR